MNAFRTLLGIQERTSPLLFNRSFHASARSNETSRQRIARLRKQRNIAKRAENDQKSSAERPHPILGLSAQNLDSWKQTKLYKCMVHPEDLEITPTRATTAPPPEPTYRDVLNGKKDMEVVPPPTAINFGLTEKTAEHLLETLPRMTVAVSSDESIRHQKVTKAADEQRPATFHPYALNTELMAQRDAAAQAKVMARIIDLKNASAKGIAFENRRRIIQAFSDPSVKLDPMKPDTGRAEVQAALITAKIRNLWNHLGRSGNNKDIHNRRALTLLVHQRAKVLKYLKRSDPVRYEVLLPQIGLDKGAVEGEIVVR